ncbi:MAG: hypothetical protein QCH96_07185 [Candidatus Thermoplasmatota archaeon]|nr:hypothetical protein [Candidatus Thermoplasmatota archaeon]
MNTYMKNVPVLILILSTLFLAFPSAALIQQPPITMDFYYASSCPSCDEQKDLVTINFLENPRYETIVNVSIKDVDTEEMLAEWKDLYDFFPYPFLVISSPYQKTSEISEYKMTVAYIENIIDEFLFNIPLIPLLLNNQSLSAELFYDNNCTNCTQYLTILNRHKQNYSIFFNFEGKNIETDPTNYQQYLTYSQNNTSLRDLPFIILTSNNTTIHKIDSKNISTSLTYLSNVYKEYIQGIPPDHSKDPNIIETPFGEINISNWSLPLLAIILGGMDSFNPCAFFILIFLLNLLIYARSRRRMLLIGGIFIFFSGFLYMIFMFLMYEAFRQLQTSPATMIILTIGVGLIVLPMGVLNIKDFFFFKKGASLSIPDDKKPKIYKQMRLLVKNPKLGATILGTIFLAATVNFYELLCTLGLPFAFTKALSNYNITEQSTSYYSYILLYNIIYVIPLIIIVFLFVITLGKRKLTEWHGQVMKLVSGIMLSCFGIIFIVNYRILDNPLTPILLLLGSLGSAYIISNIWKKIYLSNKKEPGQ